MVIRLLNNFLFHATLVNIDNKCLILPMDLSNEANHKTRAGASASNVIAH